MTELRITVRNTSDTGGTFLTPVYLGFHDGSFDLFDAGSAASAGLESLAEDGSPALLAQERLAADPESVGTVVAGAAGPIVTGEQTSGTITVDGTESTHVSFAAMILPSNDAFIGTDEAIELFDGDGNFAGATTVTLQGSDVYDAGTEYNTEEDAAFLNQTAPNTGLTEGGVVRLHEGFNGSLGNPDGILGNPDGTPGAQNILGGTNAFGEAIDPVAADFTQPGAQIAEIHINEVTRREGTDGRDVIRGDSTDDIINGLDGRDVIFGRSGYDEIDGGDGADLIFGGKGFDILVGGGGRDKIFGGADGDIIDGGAGRDFLKGGSGDDAISGGNGRDHIWAGTGDDLVIGGAGRDWLHGGQGADTFAFTTGDGRDKVRDFDVEQDTILLDGTDITSFEEVLENASGGFFGTSINYGSGDVVHLTGVWVSELSEDNFSFV